MSNSHNEYEVFNALLEKFLSLPKTNSNPTFMEICQMGGDRFEELSLIHISEPTRPY